MIRLVLEDDATVLTTVWRLRTKGAFSSFSGFRAELEYPSLEAAEDRLREAGWGSDRWMEWMEAYEVTVARGTAPTRTEVMTWPAREDFDAWAARVKSGTRRKKRRPRIAVEPGIGTGEPTSASSAPSGTLEVVGSDSASEEELLVKAALSAKKAIFRAQVLASLARAARKREAAETGMDWEIKA